MARQVDIRFGVNAQGVPQKLEQITRKLKQINNEYKKFEKGIDIKINTKASSREIEMLSSKFGELTKAQNQTALMSQRIAYGVENLGKSMGKTNKTTKESTNNILALALAYRTLRITQGLVKDQMNLESAITNVGVASQMTSSEIIKLRGLFQDMSATMPISATELAKVANMLVRTGQSFADAQKITAESGKLAVASGDDMQKTAQIVTKILVALKLDTDNLEDAFNTLHTTTLKTPTNLAELGDSMKAAAGSMGAFISITDQSGYALDGYKQKLLETASSSIGAFRSMGRSASQSGLHVRIMTSTMVSMRNSAKKILDEKLLQKAVTVPREMTDGTIKNVQLTADTISKMAQEDLPSAINLMSKLYSDGIISMQDVLQIFTKRHGLYIANLFKEINGNLDEFNESITKGADYLVDFDKQMMNVNNQLQLFKNQLTKVVADKSIITIKDGMNGLLMVANDLMEEDIGGALIGWGTSMSIVGASSIAVAAGLMTKEVM